MRLITNLQFVTYRGGSVPIRTNCSALLFEPGHPMIPDVTNRLRGFAHDGTAEAFDARLPCNVLSYTMEPVASPHIFLGDDGPRPLASGYRLTFEDGTVFDLIAQNAERELDVSDYPDDFVPDIWGILRQKVFEYWPYPNFLMTMPVPVAEVPGLFNRIPV